MSDQQETPPPPPPPPSQLLQKQQQLFQLPTIANDCSETPSQGLLNSFLDHLESDLKVIESNSDLKKRFPVLIGSEIKGMIDDIHIIKVKAGLEEEIKVKSSFFWSSSTIHKKSKSSLPLTEPNSLGLKKMIDLKLQHQKLLKEFIKSIPSSNSKLKHIKPLLGPMLTYMNRILSWKAIGDGEDISVFISTMQAINHIAQDILSIPNNNGNSNTATNPQQEIEDFQIRILQIIHPLISLYPLRRDDHLSIIKLSFFIYSSTTSSIQLQNHSSIVIKKFYQEITKEKPDDLSFLHDLIENINDTKNGNVKSQCLEVEIIGDILFKYQEIPSISFIRDDLLPSIKEWLSNTEICFSMFLRISFLLEMILKSSSSSSSSSYFLVQEKYSYLPDLLLLQRSLDRISIILELMESSPSSIDASSMILTFSLTTTIVKIVEQDYQGMMMISASQQKKDSINTQMNTCLIGIIDNNGSNGSILRDANLSRSEAPHPFICTTTNRSIGHSLLIGRAWNLCKLIINLIDTGSGDGSGSGDGDKPAQKKIQADILSIYEIILLLLLKGRLCEGSLKDDLINEGGKIISYIKRSSSNDDDDDEIDVDSYITLTLSYCPPTKIVDSLIFVPIQNDILTFLNVKILEGSLLERLSLPIMQRIVEESLIKSSILPFHTSNTLTVVPYLLFDFAILGSIDALIEQYSLQSPQLSSQQQLSQQQLSQQQHVAEKIIYELKMENGNETFTSLTQSLVSSLNNSINPFISLEIWRKYIITHFTTLINDSTCWKLIFKVIVPFLYDESTFEEAKDSLLSCCSSLQEECHQNGGEVMFLEELSQIHLPIVIECCEIFLSSKKELSVDGFLIILQILRDDYLDDEEAVFSLLRRITNQSTMMIPISAFIDGSCVLLKSFLTLIRKIVDVGGNKQHALSSLVMIWDLGDRFCLSSSFPGKIELFSLILEEMIHFIVDYRCEIRDSSISMIGRSISHSIHCSNGDKEWWTLVLGESVLGKVIECYDHCGDGHNSSDVSKVSSAKLLLQLLIDVAELTTFTLGTEDVLVFNYWERVISLMAKVSLRDLISTSLEGLEYLLGLGIDLQVRKLIWMNWKEIRERKNFERIDFLTFLRIFNKVQSIVVIECISESWDMVEDLLIMDTSSSTSSKITPLQHECVAVIWSIIDGDEANTLKDFASCHAEGSNIKRKKYLLIERNSSWLRKFVSLHGIMLEMGSEIINMLYNNICIDWLVDKDDEISTNIRINDLITTLFMILERDDYLLRGETFRLLEKILKMILPLMGDNAESLTLIGGLIIKEIERSSFKGGKEGKNKNKNDDLDEVDFEEEIDCHYLTLYLEEIFSIHDGDCSASITIIIMVTVEDIFKKLKKYSLLSREESPSTSTLPFFKREKFIISLLDWIFGIVSKPIFNDGIREMAWKKCLMPLCKDIISSYCEDRKILGRMPFTRIRQEEFCHIIKKLDALKVESVEGATFSINSPIGHLIVLYGDYCMLLDTFVDDLELEKIINGTFLKVGKEIGLI